MSQRDLFSLVKEISGSIPDEDTVIRFARDVAKQYMGIRFNPHFHANGSVPKCVRRSPEIIPDRWFIVKFYKINTTATSAQILDFLDEQQALHLGGLGLMLMNKILPLGIYFLAFEDNDPTKMSVIIHYSDDTFQFGVATMNGTDYWDKDYGFVCITPDPDAPLPPG